MIIILVHSKVFLHESIILLFCPPAPPALLRCP